MRKKLAAVTGKMSPNLRKIIRSISWLSGERILAMFLSLSVGLLVTRYLGAENYGKFSYCISFVALFEPVARLGLDAIAVRDLVKEEDATQEIMGTTFLLKAIGSLLMFLTIATTVWFVNRESQLAWMTIIVAVSLLFNSFDAIEFWFQSQVISGELAIVRSILLVINSGVKVCLIWLKFPLIAFIWVALADAILKAIGTILLYRRHKKSLFNWQIDLTRIKTMLKESIPLILASVMTSIYMRIDQVMLGVMSTNTEVGNYAAAVRISEVWNFIPIAICASVFPAIIRAKQNSKEQYQQKIQQLYDSLAWISIILAVGIGLSAQTIMPWLLGEEYVAAGKILIVHIWSAPFAFLGIAGCQWLMVENLSHFTFLLTSLGTISNILLNWLLIPHFGGWGAAIATAISYGIASHLVFLLSPPLFHNGWMLTKALFIPIRFTQNLNYLKSVQKMFF
jgi:O-antigen/teichoic acid export membrane protein